MEREIQQTGKSNEPINCDGMDGDKNSSNQRSREPRWIVADHAMFFHYVIQNHAITKALQRGQIDGHLLRAMLPVSPRYPEEIGWRLATTQSITRCEVCR